MEYANWPSPWGIKEKGLWFEMQKISRSYQDEVVSKIMKLKNKFEIIEYGSLSINPQKYRLYLLKNKNFDPKKKTVLITGGVHGYETSGVHGALLFLEESSDNYIEKFNIICTPCISPWGYETINRWNNLAIDPNRSFFSNSPAEECHLFLSAMDKLNVEFYVHFDLHETTDTDNSVFRIALSKRDNKEIKYSEIPDGFYTVTDKGRTQIEFQNAIINSVKNITHIAPADENGEIIGSKVISEGIIEYDMKKLFLCGGFSDAIFTSTTEVYPDSIKMTPEICNKAQVAAITGGLDYICTNHLMMPK